MEAALKTLKDTPLPTLLTLVGLAILFIGFVNKLGGFIEVSAEQRRWSIPIGLSILALGLTLNFWKPDANPTPVSVVNSTPLPSNSLSPSDTDTKNRDVVIKPTSNNLEFRQGKEWRTSSNYRLVFQDGKLALYNPFNTKIWDTGTNNADLFTVQTDGNVVLHEGERLVWSTNTVGNPGAYFSMQFDGNLVVYRLNGQSIWASGTDNR